MMSMRTPSPDPLAHDALAACRLFAGLDERTLDLLTAALRSRRYRRDEVRVARAVCSQQCVVARLHMGSRLRLPLALRRERGRIARRQGSLPLSAKALSCRRAMLLTARCNQEPVT